MFQFNNMTQTFEEIEEPTRFQRVMHKKFGPYPPVIVVPIMVFALFVGLSFTWHGFVSDMKEIRHAHSVKHQTINQGVSQ